MDEYRKVGIALWFVRKFFDVLLYFVTWQTLLYVFGVVSATFLLFLAWSIATEKRSTDSDSETGD